MIPAPKSDVHPITPVADSWPSTFVGPAAVNTSAAPSGRSATRRMRQSRPTDPAQDHSFPKGCFGRASSRRAAKRQPGRGMLATTFTCWNAPSKRVLGSSPIVRTSDALPMLHRRRFFMPAATSSPIPPNSALISFARSRAAATWGRIFAWPTCPTNSARVKHNARLFPGAAQQQRPAALPEAGRRAFQGVQARGIERRHVPRSRRITTARTG